MKSVRKEIYEMIRERLKGLEGVKHVDLWNHNVEFVEQEESWARPAVFVEFAPIQWSALVDGLEYRAEPEVRLHVVTDWAGGADGDDAALEESLGGCSICWRTSIWRWPARKARLFWASIWRKARRTTTTRSWWKTSRFTSAWREKVCVDQTPRKKNSESEPVRSFFLLIGMF